MQRCTLSIICPSRVISGTQLSQVLRQTRTGESRIILNRVDPFRLPLDPSPTAAEVGAGT